MPGVLGNMLSAFPELMKDYEVFKMEPRVGAAGYGERYGIRTVTGYMSYRKAREMGVEGDARTKNDRATFWEQHDFLTGESRIEQGDYVEVKKHVYIFVEDDNFGDEGGFTRWTVQRVAGITDRQVTNTKVDEAIRNDYA
jgi:hypothetical protein